MFVATLGRCSPPRLQGTPVCQRFQCRLCRVVWQGEAAFTVLHAVHGPHMAQGHHQDAWSEMGSCSATLVPTSFKSVNASEEGLKKPAGDDPSVFHTGRCGASISEAERCTLDAGIY